MTGRLRIDREIVRSLVVLGSLAVAAIAVFGLTWSGVARTTLVAEQIPFLVSGGIGGTVVIGFSLSLASIQERRVREAQYSADVDRVLLAASRLLDAVRDDAGVPS